MQTCEIWVADLDPTEGFEQSGKRPVLILSGNAMNSKSGLLIVCPLTTKIKNFAGTVVLEPTHLNGLSQKSEVLTFQIRTISSSRLVKKIGEVPKTVHHLLLQNFIKICTY